MSNTEYKNVIFDVSKTESEILSLGANSIIKGQMWIASDTKRIIWREKDGSFTFPKAESFPDVPTDGKYYVRKDGIWVDITSVVESAHSHDNKAILNLVEEAYTTDEKSKLVGIEDGAQKNMSARITNPTLAELQALVDKGVTVFYNGSEGGANCILPSGVINFKSTNYTFISGKQQYGFEVNDGESIEFNFGTITGAHTVNFDSLLFVGDGSELKINDIGSSHIAKLVVNGNSTYYTGGVLKVEELEIDGWFKNTNTNTNLVYQYLSPNGTGTLLDHTEAVITEQQQDNWLRNDQTDWNATSGNTELLNKPDMVGVFSTAQELQDLHDKGYTTFVQRGGVSNIGDTIYGDAVTGEVTLDGSAPSGSIIDYQFIGNFQFEDFVIKYNNLGGYPRSVVFTGRILFDGFFNIELRGAKSEINHIRGINKDTAIFGNSSSDTLSLNYISTLTFNCTMLHRLGSFDNISSNSSVDLTTHGAFPFTIGIAELPTMDETYNPTGRLGVVRDTDLFSKADKSAVDKDLDNVKRITRGWVDQDNVKVLTSTVGNEGIITLSTRTAVDNHYYCDGVKYTLNHSTDVVLNAGDVEGDRWCFLVDGVLTMSDNFIYNQCPVRLVGWDSTNKEFIKSIPQAHGTIMDEATQGYNHLTKGSVAEKSQGAFKLYDFTTGGDGSTDAEYQFKRKSGRYRDEDIPYDIPEYTGTFAPVYYEDYVGGEGVSRRLIPTGVGNDLYDSYVSNNQVTGMPYYNKEISEGVRGLADVPDGYYFMSIVFAFGDDDSDAPKYEIAVMGQNVYATLNEARINVSSEVARTEGNYETLQEICAIGVVIYQADSSFTNKRKCKVVPFSTETDGKFQPYYNMTDRESMETVLAPITPETGYDIIGAWGWARYTTFYGYCANDLTTETNVWTGATTFSIHRNKLDGQNMANALDLIPSNAVLKITNQTRNAEVIVTFSGDFTFSNQIYTGTIASIDDNNIGDGFLDTDTVVISIQASGSYFDEKVKVSATDTSTGYLGDKIIGGNGVSVEAVDTGGGVEVVKVSSVYDVYTTAEITEALEAPVPADVLAGGRKTIVIHNYDGFMCVINSQNVRGSIEIFGGEVQLSSVKKADDSYASLKIHSKVTAYGGGATTATLDGISVVVESISYTALNNPTFTYLNGATFMYEGSLGTNIPNGAVQGFWTTPVQTYVDTAVFPQVKEYDPSVDEATILADGNNLVDVKTVGSWVDITSDILFDDIVVPINMSFIYNQATKNIRGVGTFSVSSTGNIGDPLYTIPLQYRPTTPYRFVSTTSHIPPESVVSLLNPADGVVSLKTILNTGAGVYVNTMDWIVV